MEGVLVIAVMAAIFGLIRWGSRPHTRIDLAAGHVTLQRGKPPKGLIHDLADVAEEAPEAEGRILLSGSRDKLHIELVGIDERLSQRIHNVVRLHGRRIR